MASNKIRKEFRVNTIKMRVEGVFSCKSLQGFDDAFLLFEMKIDSEELAVSGGFGDELKKFFRRNFSLFVLLHFWKCGWSLIKFLK